MPLTTTNTLDPFGGTFGEAEAAHLLRRSCYYPTLAQIRAAVQRGLGPTIDLLLLPDGEVDIPLMHKRGEDVYVPYGATWINARWGDVDVFPPRFESMSAWTMKVFLDAGLSLERKMWFFWMNHFGCERDGDLKASYIYTQRLRTDALGNFKQLVTDIARDSQMLLFLNGASSVAGAPNENFARELLELFTIGKGAQAGNDDYTTYTERDVRAFARALTGYYIENNFSYEVDKLPYGAFDWDRHDSGSKLLSPRFGSQVIPAGMGEQELDYCIDLIFARRDAGDYLCRKLYRYFVHYDITPEIEANVIQPMSQVFRESGFQMSAVLRVLLTSEAFFDEKARGSLIKSPLEYLLSLYRMSSQALPDELDARYKVLQRLTWPLYNARMLMWQPPSVAGWKAYYQAPLFNRQWITAATIQQRADQVMEFVEYGLYQDDELQYSLNLLDYIAGFENALDPNDLIAEAAARHLPLGLNAEQARGLKNLLIPGLPDFEWTIEYQGYLDDPNDEGRRMSVERKVRNMFNALLGSLEFHLY